MNRLTKDALRYAAEHAPEPLRGLCAARLRQERKKLATRRERSAPRRAREDAAAEAVSDATSILRARLDRRSNRCEFCTRWIGEGHWEMHHIESGALRKERQTLRNCAKTCEWCHRAYHRGDPATLVRALQWARILEFAEAAAIIERRIEKKGEAERAAGARAGRGGPDAP